MPDISWLDDFSLLAGVDEVGRGPLAGPVVAAAVIVDNSRPVDGIRDSKKLSENKREILAELIKENALAWSLGRAEAAEIDQINILQASLLAMKRAVEGLCIKPDCVAVDGKFKPALDYKTVAIVKGDSLVPAISAASIIAKVARDREMIELDKTYPGYGFSSHKGYPTRQHLQSLTRLGVCEIHRKSFSPVAKCLV